MFTRPVIFNEFLSHHGLLDEVYKAMSNPDTSEVVMTVLEILRKTNHIPSLVKERKSESKSTAFRNEGNKAYGNKEYQKALTCYNKALLYAPKNSRAMKLAYSNRSALLHKIKAFSACLRDIETCFSMGCPLDIIEKVRKRKAEAKGNLWMEKLAEDCKHSIFSEEYFQFNVKRNPQIPCASTDVGVIVENQVPRIVATTDIKVGTVLAVETAFVSQNDPQNAHFSCFYCHKMNLNMKPCDGCCFALFCDENCREMCMKEYHGVECQIIETLEAISGGSMSRLGIKAALKIVNMCKDWTDLVAGTETMGLQRMKNSLINQIYDSNYMFSLLSTKDERHFINGPMYNFSFSIASIIHHLDKLACFFPLPLSERNSAMRALARLMMFLNIYSNHTQMVLSVSINEQEKTEFHNAANLGWFSFIGKLKNSCNPNVLAVGLNKKIGLLAVNPIKRGSELTLSYVGHWLDNPTDKAIRHRNMFVLYGVVCNCLICTEDYKLTTNGKLTDMQRKNFKKLNLEEMRDRFNPRNIPEVFTKLCKTLAFLSDLPHTDEYCQVYRLFRRCLLYLQDLTTENVILDYV